MAVFCCKSCNVEVHFINKNHSKMAQNAIYKDIRFKIFLGGMPPDPPSMSCLWQLAS